MSGGDAGRGSPGGWRPAFALAWALGCGWFYARMVIVTKIPALAAWLGWTR